MPDDAANEDPWAQAPSPRPDLVWNDGTGPEETRGEAYVPAPSGLTIPTAEEAPAGIHAPTPAELDAGVNVTAAVAAVELRRGVAPEPCELCGSAEEHAPHALEKLRQIYETRLRRTTRPMRDSEVMPTLAEIDAAIAEEAFPLEPAQTLRPGEILLLVSTVELDRERCYQIEKRLGERLGADIPFVVLSPSLKPKVLRVAGESLSSEVE